LYKNFPLKNMTIEVNIRTAGTPKANGKQSPDPKQSTLDRIIGVMKVDIKDPALMAK
jgi:hypothetical protein